MDWRIRGISRLKVGLAVVSKRVIDRLGSFTQVPIKNQMYMIRSPKNNKNKKKNTKKKHTKKITKTKSGKVKKTENDRPKVGNRISSRKYTNLDASTNKTPYLFRPLIHTGYEYTICQVSKRISRSHAAPLAITLPTLQATHDYEIRT